eukprot:TRINITY_DN2961_c0_g1_i4.p1 TRINITY_DN2961_c0_g1~~TRINITY_DN2961_c0_g1_i4.p1  ORF type:complete len:235 (+),score=-32.46 TRINITY_DN2961_c0_g1_i4:602-1306(+)
MMMWENWPIFWWDVVLQISINSTKVSLLLFIYQLFVLNIICQLGKIFVVINICKIYVFYTIIIIFFFKSEQIRFIFIDLPIVLYKYYIYIKLRRFFSQNKFQYGIFLGYNKFENYNKFEFWGLEQFGGRGLAEYLFIQELKIQERVIDLINIIINILILSLQINYETYDISFQMRGFFFCNCFSYCVFRIYFWYHTYTFHANLVFTKYQLNLLIVLTLHEKQGCTHLHKIFSFS